MANLIVEVIGGVDTHKEFHAAAALDRLGGVLATAEFRTTARGYIDLLRWLRSFGHVVAVGVEGTGSWGAGLARFLAVEGVNVVEVNRPDRQLRRRHGKTDMVDAIAAGRAVLAGTATSTPKSTTGLVECIRLLRIARRSAMKARTQAVNQFHSVIDTAPEDLRAELNSVRLVEQLRRAARFRNTEPVTPRAAAKVALTSISRRWADLQEEIVLLDGQLQALVKQTAPDLVASHGIGPDTAGALLVAAGDNPERLHNEAAFAALCGSSPVQASSGKTTRHRLNRGGNREANNALWRIVLVRMGSEPRTREYVQRRTNDGLSKPEIMRCLKRYVAREVFQTIRSLGLEPPITTPQHLTP